MRIGVVNDKTCNASCAGCRKRGVQRVRPKTIGRGDGQTQKKRTDQNHDNKTERDDFCIAELIFFKFQNGMFLSLKNFFRIRKNSYFWIEILYHLFFRLSRDSEAH